MSTRITLLVDNISATRETLAEPGFAAWITHQNSHTLFDTGAGHALRQNMQTLKKDAQTLRRLALSHGHWDHTGGLEALLDMRRDIDILAHPAIFQERYSTRINRRGEKKYHAVGIPFSREALEQRGARFHLTSEYHEIEPGFYFSGEIPRPEGWESSDKGLCLPKDGGYVLDPVRDDISLLFETDSGPVVLFGCAHAGIETILDYFAQQYGCAEFFAVIGGTHLMRADNMRIDAVIETFERYRIQKIITTHCTGFHAMSRLYQHFGKKFIPAHVGRAFTF